MTTLELVTTRHCNATVPQTKPLGTVALAGPEYERDVVHVPLSHTQKLLNPHLLSELLKLSGDLGRRISGNDRYILSTNTKGYNL